MRPVTGRSKVRTSQIRRDIQMAVQTPAINMDKLNAFMGQVVGELGATVNAGLIVLGDRLGLYKAMAESGPITSAQLAAETGPGERAKVAEVGCGLGASTRLMAQAYPRSRFTGFDYHPESIELARQKAKDAGLQDRTTFEVAKAAAFPGSGYDLIAMFDCLHDMGDPVGAARHVRQALAADGTWLIVEPIAGDRVEQNLNPVGRAYYAFSTFICTPNSLSQDVGLALGAQAGEARIKDVATAGGATRFPPAA